MSLSKKAVLKLRLEGFTKANARAGALGAKLSDAEAAAKRLGATGEKTGDGVGDSLAEAGDEAKGLQASVDKAEAATEKLAASGKRAGGGIRGSFAGAESAITKLASVLTVARAAFSAVTGAARGLFETVSRGGSVANVAASFTQLAGGADAARQKLQSLEQATGGAVAKSDLMVAANRLMLSGLQITDSQMREAAKAAVILGNAQGFSAKEAVDRLSLALAKQEPELLDEIGLKVDLTKALQAEAAKRGVAVTALTAQTRSQVFANAVMEQARERSGKLGGSVESAVTATQTLSKVWKDIGDKFSAFIAQNPAIIGAFKSIAKAVESVMRAVAPLVNALATVVGFGAQVVGTVVGGVADVVGGAFDAAGVSAPNLIPAGAGASPAARPQAQPSPFPVAPRRAFEEYGAAVEQAARESGRALVRRMEFSGT